MSSSRLLLATALFTTASLPASAVLVFSDDFSEAAGTALDGKASDTGLGWNDTASSIPVEISTSNTYDSSGGGRSSVGTFASALGAGQTLTLTFDTLGPSGNFWGFFGGVSTSLGLVELLTSAGNTTGTADLSIGDTPNSAQWAVTRSGGLDLTASGSSNDARETTATFTYVYDTGAWTLSNTDGASLSGSTDSGLAFTALRVRNDGGGDIHLDNLSVDIVPEPSAVLLSALGLLALARRQR